MSGTKQGGLRAAQTNKERHGKEFYKVIGSKGGQNGTTGGFKSDKVGADGLTGKERARIAGAVGGRVSKRGPARTKKEAQPSNEILRGINLDLEEEKPRRLIQDVLRRVSKR